MKRLFPRALGLLATSFAIGIAAVAFTPSSAKAAELVFCEQLQTEGSLLGCTIYSAICHDLENNSSYLDYTLICTWWHTEMS